MLKPAFLNNAHGHKKAQNINSVPEGFSIHPARKVGKFSLKALSLLPAYSSPLAYLFYAVIGATFLPFMIAIGFGCVSLGLFAGHFGRKMNREDQIKEYHYKQAMQHAQMGHGVPEPGMVTGVSRPAGVAMVEGNEISTQYSPNHTQGTQERVRR